MATTVTSVVSTARGNSQRGRNPYYVENTIDFADITVDPSSDDIVQAIAIPAGSLLVSAGFEVVEALTIANTGSDETVDLGTDVNDDKYVAAFDIDAATAGDYGTSVDGGMNPEIHGSANTLDLTFAGTGDGISAGKIRVFAVLMDVTEAGDLSANEVDRDTLA
mgnify:CR=1 FL=1